jgi:hypothetical protein
MQERRAPRLGLAMLFFTWTVAITIATLAMVWVMVQLTPPCPGPWCLYALIYLPISAVGAAILAIVMGRWARLGGRGYVVSLLAGVAGYAAAWFYILRGLPFA